MNEYTKKIKKLQKDLDLLKAERNERILEMREEGKTLDEIGAIFEISKEAVRKIIDKINKVDKK